MNTSPETRAKQTAKATRWLRNLLAHGPVLVDEILRAAQRADLPRVYLHAAFNQIDPDVLFEFRGGEDAAWRLPRPRGRRRRT